MIKNVSVFFRSLLWLLVLSSSQAFAGHVFLDPMTDKETSNVPFDASEGFVDVGKGVKMYGLILTPSNADAKYLIEGGEVFELPDGKRSYIVGAAEASIIDQSKQTIAKVKWTPDGSGILYDGCEMQLFQAAMSKSRGSQADPSKAPFPIAISCNLQSTPATLLVSVPAQVQWDQSTLVEMAGKGERWRLFQLPVAGSADTLVGKLTFRFEEKLWTVALNVNKLSEKAALAIIPKQEKEVSIGYAMTTLGGTAGSFNSSDFVFRFQGLSEPLFERIRLGLLVNMNFGLQATPGLIFGKDIGLSTGYYFGINPQGARDPLSGGLFAEMRSTDFKHSPSFFSLQATYFNVGGETRWRFTPSQRLSLTARFGNFGSSVLKSQLSVQFGYTYNTKFFGREVGLGPSFFMQSLNIQETTGATRTVGVNQFMISTDF